MGTVADVISIVVGAAILVAVGVLAVRFVGPFVDGSALFRAGPGGTTPPGAQEEDAPRWDFTGARVDASGERASGDEAPRPGGPAHPPDPDEATREG